MLQSLSHWVVFSNASSPTCVPTFGRLGLSVVGTVPVALATAAVAFMVKPVLDDIFIARDREALRPPASGVVVLTYAVLGLGRFCYNTAYVGEEGVRRIRNQMVEHMLGLDLSLLLSTGAASSSVGPPVAEDQDRGVTASARALPRGSGRFSGWPGWSSTTAPGSPLLDLWRSRSPPTLGRARQEDQVPSPTVAGEGLLGHHRPPRRHPQQHGDHQGPRRSSCRRSASANRPRASAA